MAIVEFTDDTIMPFGAHQGKKLSEIPFYYLEWLNSQIEDKSKLHWNVTEKAINIYVHKKKLSTK